METTATATAEMKLARSRKRLDGATIDGDGFILYGTQPNGKWLERWFPSEAAALAYAGKRNYNVTKIER